MSSSADMLSDIGEVLLSEEAIARRVQELGTQIAQDYAGRTLTLVSVLKGSLPFMADLMRQIKDLSASIAGEDVLLVEDIIDTGLTLNYLVRYLRGKNPSSLRICTLLDKPARRLVEIPVDYQGFEIPDQFVVGYGLDYGERYRNLRFVGVLRPEVYSSAG
jgi:hypoxanthine-guanine phosphoribosyltransferase